MQKEEIRKHCEELVGFFEQKKFTIADAVDITATLLVHILGKEAKSLEHGLQVLDNMKENLKTLKKNNESSEY